MDVTSINNGDYIKVKGVDFGTGAVSFDARVASATSGGNIELHLDSQTGTLVGTCAVQGTGGDQTWATRSCTVSGATGIHDLYLRFTGGSGALFNFNWWRFTPRDPLPDGGAPDAGGGGAGQGGQGGQAGQGGQGGQGGSSGRGGTGGLGGTGGRGGSGGSAAGGTSAGGRGGSATGGASAGGSGGSAIGGTTGGSIGRGGAAGGGAGSSGTAGSTGSGGSSVTGTGGGAGDTGGAGGCSCTVGDGGSGRHLVVLALGLIFARRRGRRRTEADTRRTW